MFCVLFIWGLSCVAAERGGDPSSVTSCPAPCVEIDVLKVGYACRAIKNTIEPRDRHEIKQQFFGLIHDEPFSGKSIKLDPEVVWLKKVDMLQMDDFIQNVGKKVGKKSVDFFDFVVRCLPASASENSIGPGFLRNDSLYMKLIEGLNMLDLLVDILHSEKRKYGGDVSRDVAAAYLRYIFPKFDERWWFKKLELIPGMKVVRATKNTLKDLIWEALKANGITCVRSALSYLHFVITSGALNAVADCPEAEIGKVCDSVRVIGKRQVALDFLLAGSKASLPSPVARGLLRYACEKLQPSLWESTCEMVSDYVYFGSENPLTDKDEESAYAQLWAGLAADMDEDFTEVSLPKAGDGLVLCNVLQMRRSYKALMQDITVPVDRAITVLERYLYLNEAASSSIGTQGVCFEKISVFKLAELIERLDHLLPKRTAVFYDFLVQSLPGGDWSTQQESVVLLGKETLYREFVEGTDVLPFVHQMLRADKRKRGLVPQFRSAEAYVQHLSPRFSEETWFQLLERDLYSSVRDSTPDLIWGVLEQKGVTRLVCLLSYLKHVILISKLNLPNTIEEVKQVKVHVGRLGKITVTRNFLLAGCSYVTAGTAAFKLKEALNVFEWTSWDSLAETLSRENFDYGYLWSAGL